jgi:hypothetical protein
MTFLGRESSQKMNIQKFTKRWTRPKYLKLADLDGSNTDYRMEDLIKNNYTLETVYL